MLRDQLTLNGRPGAIAAGTAACLLIVGIGVSLGVASASADSAVPSAGPAPEKVIAALDEPADAFPAGVDTDSLIRGGIDRSSLQKLGADGAQSYWTGLDNAGDICLITILDVRLTAAAACNAPENVEANGLDLSAAGDNHHPDYQPIVAVLLPDSVNADPVAEPSYAREDETIAEAAADGADESSKVKGRSYNRPPSPKANPWKKHGSNLVVAKQSEVPADVNYEFGRKRGHGGPTVSYHG